MNHMAPTHKQLKKCKQTKQRNISYLNTLVFLEINTYSINMSLCLRLSLPWTMVNSSETDEQPGDKARMYESR